ncbi:site-specific integrase [Microbulbifer sp. 2205BS26-8]|uniref:tyrosine-type recombinase/integrase n=1 Tax=Microbulbifer sp. 2205BS26-8 TaxID=3064386 RepID=UPI00273FD6F9|nr:site-specific integrase [Microbulbifer sp. 2205BS26-8]MDP5208124.1 site-specific integrase [Microbulbifer sp. 2205BS26-8]
MATFIRRGKTWRAQVRLRGQSASATFDSKRQAQEWAQDIEYQIRQGTYGKPNAGTFGDLMKRFAESVSPSRAGARWEAVRLKKLLKDPISQIFLSELKTQHFAEFRDRRLTTVSSGAVNREINLLSAVCRYALREWHLLDHHPIQGLERPRNPRPRDRRINEQEIDRLCTALDWREMAPQTYRQEVAWAFLVALETAMRLGEILALTRDDLDIPGRYVTVQNSKNGDKRHIPLSRRAVELFQMVEDRSRGFLRVGRDMASAMFRRARIDVEIDDLRFHDTRHEALTRLARKLDVLDLARMVGHRDPRSLMIYYNATATEIASRLD